jgi:hypothetical protein
MSKTEKCMLFGIFLISIISFGASQEESAPIISLMVDVDMPSSPEYSEIRSSEVSLNEMYNDIVEHGATATIFLTRDVTASRIRLILAQYSLDGRVEFAVSGQNSSDRLSSMSISEQEALIDSSMKVASAARVCGLSEVEVLGFMPPGFDQNDDTYKALDNLSIQYNAGFQAGLIYAPGHENDIWPYKIEGYSFSAVPISTVNISGRLVPLYDKKIVEKGLTAKQWVEILTNKFEESYANNEPMVVLLSTSISGSGEYLDALKEFIDYARSKESIFVKTKDLVKMTTTGTLDSSEEGEKVCLTCGQDEFVKINISREKPEPASLTNETELNENID